MYATHKWPVQRFLFLYTLIVSLAGCATPATFEGMVPASFEIARKHPYAVRISVTGGQEDPAIGRPHITDAAFTKALIESVTKSQVFSKVSQDQTAKADYLLTVTLFSMDKLVFGRKVTMEAGWTLRRADTGTVVWQESIISEFSDSNVKLATEGAAKNNIAQGLGKISKLNLAG
jgi:hypothetical protein